MLNARDVCDTALKNFRGTGEMADAAGQGITARKAFGLDNLDEIMDQRRYRRISCQTTARINIDGSWQNRQLIDLSGGGCGFRSETPPPTGSNLLVQVRGLGIIRARVIRCWGLGFAVEFNAEDYDVGALVDNLTMLANPGLFSPTDSDGEPERQATTATQKAAQSCGHKARQDIPGTAAPVSSESTEPPQQHAAGEEDASKAKRGHPLRTANKTLG